MSVFLSPLAGAGAQFFDGAGAPLAGGKIFTYTAGTTTPEATYTSISGATAHTNPIVLDSEGRVPAEIWLTESVSYKFVLETAASVQIGTYDDLSGINDLTVSGISWANVSGTPTTLAGYGITDALSSATAASAYAPIASPTFTGTALIPDNAPSNTNFPIGYREAPLNSKTAGYTLIASDAGKTILMNGSSVTLTIPANASVPFPTGTVFIVINVNASALSIAITSDTLTLVNSSTTGTRTLAQNGVATCIKIGATSWLISGAGLT
jgi:hypothetical protein